MISSVASYNPAIAVAHLSPLTSILRFQLVRNTSAWCSSSVRASRNRPDDSYDSLRDRFRPRNKEICPTRSPNIMGTTFPRYETTSSSIVDIEEIHRRAILGKQSTYIDPSTGFTVFTELAHLKRGKCCGNQCRHCPFGWSNVRVDLAEGFGDSPANNEAKVISGDRKGTELLVKRILNGTYYDNDESSLDVSRSSRESSYNMETIDGEQTHMIHLKNKGQGKGGSAGGTLTSKNVPYTRTGDRGTAQLFTGERRNKDDIVFEALGTVDELCSIVGVAYADLTVSREKLRTGKYTAEISDNDSQTSDVRYGDLPEQLLDIMSRLFDVGSLIARPSPQTPKDTESTNEKRGFNAHHTAILEDWIDTMTEKLPELTSFIIPTGSPASAQLHVARTVCRRAERRMVPLVHTADNLDPAALAYVNRLSDYLFTAARFVNYCDDEEEVQYRSADHGLDGRKNRNDFNGTRERVVVKLKK